jgi:metallo-beta-lactamase family protein
MKIRFIGPLGKVTGSCTWMQDEARGWNFLVDCGMQQGERTAAGWNACDWPFDPKEIRFVILTHAHVDHCGLIPMLYKRGFRGLVYCSNETAEIASILLRDAAELSDIGFTAADVDAIRWHEPLRGPLFGRFHPVDQDLFVRFFRSGHVVGALSVSVHWGAPGPNQRSIAFSGDLGPNEEDSEGLPFLRHRMNVGKTDFSVVESTYGATVRTAEQADPERRRARLRSLLDRTIERKGTLVIPAFALGRVQDVLFDLHWIVAEDPQRYATVRFHLDAPSAQKMNAVLLEAASRTENNGVKGKVRPVWLGKQMFRWFDLDDTEPAHVQMVLDICRMTLLPNAGRAGRGPHHGNAVARAWRPIFRTVENRKLLARGDGICASVYVVSSGSCDGGPAAWWLPKLLSSPGNTVALAGFCSASTVGGQLLSLAQAGPGERRRLTGDIAWPGGATMPMARVEADIVALSGYSAHADQAGLLDWIFDVREDLRPIESRLVFIQHGGNAQRQQLASAIGARARGEGVAVGSISPSDPVAWFDLDRNASEMSEEGCLREMEDEIARLSRELARRRRGTGHA